MASQKFFGTRTDDPTGLFQGRRLRMSPYEPKVTPQPGDYWLAATGQWMAVPPTGGRPIELASGAIIERQSDGTISTGDLDMRGWSGRIREGVWISDITGEAL